MIPMMSSLNGRTAAAMYKGLLMGLFLGCLCSHVLHVQDTLQREET